MIKAISANPVTLFLIKAFGLFTIWYLVYELWLHPAGWFDTLIIDNIIYLSAKLLTFLGYALIQGLGGENMRTIGIDGTHGLWVGDACNGITLFALFAGFVIAYPGPVKRKLWFIPAGLIAIHLFNVLRVAALSIIDYHTPEYLNFNHTYTFTIIVYSFVFALWILWANKLSRK